MLVRDFESGGLCVIDFFFNRTLLMCFMVHYNASRVIYSHMGVISGLISGYARGTGGNIQ